MLNLKLELDQSLVPTDREVVRHLIARIGVQRAQAVPAPAPLDLALVIDASGSMAGAPLAAATAATLELARTLPDSTRLTVVSFADDVVVHADGVMLDEAGRAELLARVGALSPRGSTNLHAGWRNACSLLLADGEDPRGRTRRVVVLSDGHANRGLVDPHALGAESGAQAERGILSSCIGIGDGYSPQQLAAIAAHGGGECHDAADAQEIVEIMRGEVLSFAAIVAEGVELVIDLPDDVQASEDSGLPMTLGGRRAVLGVGALRAGVERAIAVRLVIPAGGPAAAVAAGLEFHAHLEWRDPGSLVRCSGAVVTVRAQRSTATPPPPGVDAARTVLAAWQARIVSRATALNRDGDQLGLEQLWREEYEPFAAYARHHEATLGFLRTLDAIRARCERPMHERTRRVAADLARKGSRQSPVYYQRSKGLLFDQFGDQG
jgi:Ca-activated chloride channel family protein